MEKCEGSTVWRDPPSPSSQIHSRPYAADPVGRPRHGGRSHRARVEAMQTISPSFLKRRATKKARKNCRDYTHELNKEGKSSKPKIYKVGRPL